jgi:hypothetical protein
MEAATTGAETPNLSTPATPGTPAPLFAGPRVDSLSYDRKSMPRCKCLPVDAWMAPNACVLEIPAPDVSLTRKVRHALYTLRAARSPPWMGFPSSSILRGFVSGTGFLFFSEIVQETFSFK